MSNIKPRHIRIFLSSPGDVADERSIALSVIENILYDPDFLEKISIRAVAWDKPGNNVPMMATMTPQLAITAGMPKPSDCDIVVVLFWSRMGTQLPQEYHKEDGSPYLSGTEWEFEDALKTSKLTGSPKILVYKRTDNINLNPADPDFLKKYEQWQRVQKFFNQFVDNKTGAINMGFNEYSKPEDFRLSFNSHLKAILKKLISEPINPSIDPSPVKKETEITREIWSGSPFPGLRSYSEKEAPIFFGRGRETDDLIKQLDESRFVSVVGVSGSGKSSLVAAGLVPRLRKNAISTENQGSKDWYIIQFTPKTDPFYQLAGALIAGIPALKGDPIEFSTRKEKLALILKKSPQALHETIQSTLNDEDPWVEVLLFIDQFEELFTLSHNDSRQPFISMLAQSVQSTSLANLLHNETTNNRIRVILTLRADFYHRCVEYPEIAGLLRNGSFPLAAPSQNALQDMITKPAERANLLFDNGLPERILHDTGDEPGSLALVAYTLDELYHAGKATKHLSHADYEALGGVRGAIGRRAEAVFEKLSEEAKKTLPRIFQSLVTVDHRGIATRERSELEKIAVNEAAAELITAFTGARLFVQSRGEHGAIVEVAHEALFKSWNRLAEWIEVTRGDLYQLRQMERAAKLWNEKGQSRDFLWLGEKGKELQEVLARMQPNLSEIEQLFARPEQVHLEDELSDPVTSHARRSEIGTRLDVIGDTRRGVGLRTDGLPDITWIPIPRGLVQINDQTFTVQSFYIAKYPITFKQFQVFLERRDGFEDDKWWANLPERYRKQKMRDQLFKSSNHPRDNVSWYQSCAFTNWLSANLPPNGYPDISISIDMNQKWGIRLPTEWEWQQAATSGNPDNLFPWGKDWDNHRCNTLESGLNKSMAVGMYPDGGSSLGVMDLAGNIREWCLNEFTSFNTRINQDANGRASRGGSYTSIHDFARCVSRYCDEPDEQTSDDGFRVVFAVEVNEPISLSDQK